MYELMYKANFIAHLFGLAKMDPVDQGPSFV